MEQFEKLFDSVINEEAPKTRVEKKRSFYPKKVQNAGGFSKEFIECLGGELQRLKSGDPTIKDLHILKALDFEIRG